jgi:tryptophanyl-tRNA synthetase
MSARPRVLSGMRPTGRLHLGNFLGAEVKAAVGVA